MKLATKRFANISQFYIRKIKQSYINPCQFKFDCFVYMIFGK